MVHPPATCPNPSLAIDSLSSRFDPADDSDHSHERRTVHLVIHAVFQGKAFLGYPEERVPHWIK